MKVSKKVFVAMLIMLVMIIGMATSAQAAIGDDVTVTVTSTPENGQEVKAGDEITYSITMKNDSDKDYVMPMLITEIPDGTAYVSVSVPDMLMEPIVDEDTGSVGCLGVMLEAQSQLTFTLKVKVLETATGEINYANVEENGTDWNSDELPGAVVCMLFSADNADEFDEIDKILNSEDWKNVATIEEVQALLGERGRVKVVTTKQTHNVVTETTTPVEPENPETPKTEEPKVKEPKVEEPKPTELPKTGREINYIAIVFASVMVIAGISIVAKKENI